MNNRGLAVIAILFVGVLAAVSHTMKSPGCQVERIKAQLKEMVATEQGLRFKVNQADFKPDERQEDAELREQIRAVDRSNTVALKEILKDVDKQWITISQFGKEADNDAWLLVQHSDQDRQFQREVLARLEKLCVENETNCQNTAYLDDRVAVGEKRPQKYGTQFVFKDGVLVFNDIEDPTNIDARRAKMGLPTLKEYEDMVKEAYKPAPAVVK